LPPLIVLLGSATTYLDQLEREGIITDYYFAAPLLRPALARSTSGRPYGTK
jgi:hypothetical protein